MPPLPIDAIVAAQHGASLIPLFAAVIGGGGAAASISAVVAVRRARTQNQVDMRTVAAHEAEAAVKVMSEAMEAQAHRIERLHAEIERLHIENERQQNIIDRQRNEIEVLRTQLDQHDKRIGSLEDHEDHGNE